jgi:hypothetical protein
LLRTLVCARPPCRYRCETFVSSTRLRGFHAAALSTRLSVDDSSHRLRFPFRVSPMLHRRLWSPRTLWSASQPHDSKPYALLPSEVWSPSVFLSRTELPSSNRIHPAGSVASSGFRTLSTLCSPCDHAGLFHPASTHGVSLRGLDPHAAPYVLSNAGSLVVSSASRLTAILRLHIRGSMHAANSPPVALGFSQLTTSVPPWVCLFEDTCRR